jgi:hypothetical protein
VTEETSTDACEDLLSFTRISQDTWNMSSTHPSKFKLLFQQSPERTRQRTSAPESDVLQHWLEKQETQSELSADALEIVTAQGNVSL